MIKRLVCTGVLAGLLAGGLLALRRFRGETSYEQAVQDLEHTPASGSPSDASAV